MLEVPGLDLNAKDGNGRTIVEVAKEVGNQTIEKLLMEKCEKWYCGTTVAMPPLGLL